MGFGGFLGGLVDALRSLLEKLGIRIPRLRLRPQSGPSGTDVTIELSGLQPGEPVTLTAAGGSSGTHADARGRATVTERIYGRPGESVEVVATVGAGPATNRRLTGT